MAFCTDSPSLKGLQGRSLCVAALVFPEPLSRLSSLPRPQATQAEPRGECTGAVASAVHRCRLPVHSCCAVRQTGSHQSSPSNRFNAERTRSISFTGLAFCLFFFFLRVNFLAHEHTLLIYPGSGVLRQRWCSVVGFHRAEHVRVQGFAPCERVLFVVKCLSYCSFS